MNAKQRIRKVQRSEVGVRKKEKRAQRRNNRKTTLMSKKTTMISHPNGTG